MFKYLVISKWKPQATPELRIRMREWKVQQQEKPSKYVIEPHRMIGRCKGFYIVEGDERLREEVAIWDDLLEYEVIPIISTRESERS
jgi:hypothetical protein